MPIGADETENQIEVISSVLPTGASTSANQTTLNTRAGDLTETAPANDTASSGLNGRLQRIAQRITSTITALTDGSAKFQLTLGGNSVVITNTAPASDAYGMVVRAVPFELPTFSVVAQNIQVANNKSMIAIQNTGTSRVVLREVWIINDRTSAVTGVAGEFRVHRIDSFSGGTSLTPTKFDSMDALPSGISASTGATVSGETELLRSGTWSTDEWGPGTLDQEGLDHGLQQIEPFWKQTPNGKGLVIRQNEGVHVRFATSSTAGYFNLRFVFTAEV